MSEVIQDDVERRLVMLVRDNDKCPVEKWLDGVRDKVTRARIIRQIDKLSRGLGVQKGLAVGINPLSEKTLPRPGNTGKNLRRVDIL